MKQYGNYLHRSHLKPFPAKNFETMTDEDVRNNLMLEQIQILSPLLFSVRIPYGEEQYLYPS